MNSSSIKLLLITKMFEEDNYQLVDCYSKQYEKYTFEIKTSKINIKEFFLGINMILELTKNINNLICQIINIQKSKSLNSKIIIIIFFSHN